MGHPADGHLPTLYALAGLGLILMYLLGSWATTRRHNHGR